MKKARIAVVLIIAIILVSVGGCNSSSNGDNNHRHEALVALKEWHDKWDETMYYYYGWESHSVGNPDNEATFSELLYELMDIEPYGVPEYFAYLRAHRLYVVSSKLLYPIYQSEKEHFAALGWDEVPCCTYLGIDCSQQPHSTEYELACTEYRLAKENLTDIRFDWEYAREGLFSELD